MFLMFFFFLVDFMAEYSWFGFIFPSNVIRFSLVAEFYAFIANTYGFEI